MKKIIQIFFISTLLTGCSFAQTPFTLSIRDATGSPYDLKTIFTPQMFANYSAPNLFLGDTNIVFYPVNGVITNALIEGPYSIIFAGNPKTLTVYLPGLWATNIPGITLPINLADPRWRIGGFQTGFYFTNLLGSVLFASNAAISGVATNAAPGGNIVTNGQSAITLYGTFHGVADNASSAAYSLSANAVVGNIVNQTVLAGDLVAIVPNVTNAGGYTNINGLFKQGIAYLGTQRFYTETAGINNGPVNYPTLVADLNSTYHLALNHLGDLDVLGNYAYVPAEAWYDCGNHSNTVIAVVNAQTLTPICVAVITNHTTACSGVAVDKSSGQFIYAASFCDGTIQEYKILNGTNFVFNRSISTGVSGIQGIEVTNGYAFLSAGTTTVDVWRVDLASGVAVEIFSKNIGSAETEGVAFTNNFLEVLAPDIGSIFLKITNSTITVLSKASILSTNPPPLTQSNVINVDSTNSGFWVQTGLASSTLGYDGLLDGLYCYLPFADGDNLVVFDRSKNRILFTNDDVNKAKIEESGIISGRGLAVTNGIVRTFQTTSQFDAMSNLTFSYWFLTTNTASQETFAKHSGGINGTFFINRNNPTQLQFTTINAASSRVNLVATAPYSLADGVPHMDTVTYDGTTMKIFIDGVFKSAAAQTGLLKSTPAISAALSQGNNVIGRFDEFCAWSRALSAEEILSLYKKFAPTNAPYADTTGNFYVAGTNSVIAVIAADVVATNIYANSLTINNANISSLALNSAFALTNGNQLWYSMTSTVPAWNPNFVQLATSTNAQSKIFILTNSAGGSGWSESTSNSVPDNILSSNVALLNANQIFTGNNYFVNTTTFTNGIRIAGVTSGSQTIIFSQGNGFIQINGPIQVIGNLVGNNNTDLTQWRNLPLSGFISASSGVLTNLTVSKITLGSSGTTISNVFYVTSSLTFPLLASLNSSEQVMSASGAKTNSCSAIVTPPFDFPTGADCFAIIRSNNYVNVVVNALAAGGIASYTGTFKVEVIQH